MAWPELPTDLLRRVSPNDARAYVRAKGWLRVEGTRGNYAVFRHPSHDLDQVLVPASSGTDDFADRIQDIVVKLADMEARSPLQVLTDILNHDADMLRVRIISDLTERGSMALVDAVAMFEGVRRSILSAAHSVVKPQPYHPRLSRREADQLVKACRFEQTARGSFVVTISCPLRAVDTPQETFFGTVDCFTRATTKYLSDSLRWLNEAIAEDAIAKVLEDIDEKPRISANLCDSLLRLRPEADKAAVEYSVDWASSMPVESEQTIRNVIRFENDDFDAIEDAYLRLRPDTEPEQDFFVATVDELRGSLNDDNHREGDVTLSLLSRESGEIVKARAELAADWYQAADAAHMSGGYVLVRGVLQRGRRVSRLSRVAVFQALEPFDGAEKPNEANE